MRDDDDKLDQHEEEEGGDVSEASLDEVLEQDDESAMFGDDGESDEKPWE